MRLLKIYLRFFFRRIVVILYLLLFVLLYFKLNNEYFDVGFFEIQNPFYNFFSSFNSFFYAVVIFVIFAVTTTFTEIILTIVNSKYQDRKEKENSAIHADINSKIFKHLLETKELDTDISFVQQHKVFYSADYPRLVFINRLRRILLLTKGEINTRCIRIFHLLNSEDLLNTYLISPYLRHKLLALRIIGDFKLDMFSNKLKNLIYDKNDIIASEAMYAYAKIAVDTDFSFLIDRNQPISKLDFYIFVQIAKQYKNIDYLALINSKNPSISALGLRFAGLHYVKSAKGEIFKRINHPDEFVCQEAQYAYLRMVEELDAVILLSRFDAFNKENQLKILSLLGKYLGNQLVLNLFNSIIERSEFDIKSAALNILMQNNIVASMRFRNHPDPLIKKAFSQLTEF